MSKQTLGEMVSEVLTRLAGIEAQLKALMNRQVRAETRLVKTMRHLGLDSDGRVIDSKDAQDERQKTGGAAQRS